MNTFTVIIVIVVASYVWPSDSAGIENGTVAPSPGTIRDRENA